MNFGVIGYGYWGPNVVRNLVSLEGSQVLAIAEISPAARMRAMKALSRRQSDCRFHGSNILRLKSTPSQSFLPCGPIMN